MQDSCQVLISRRGGYTTISVPPWAWVGLLARVDAFGLRDPSKRETAACLRPSERVPGRPERVPDLPRRSSMYQISGLTASIWYPCGGDLSSVVLLCTYDMMYVALAIWSRCRGLGACPAGGSERSRLWASPDIRSVPGVHLDPERVPGSADLRSACGAFPAISERSRPGSLILR